MYCSFFGLRERPFTMAPDPEYLFLSQQHGGALNHLIYGIKSKEGFIVITGKVGTGKTTLSRALLRRLDESVHTALILNPPHTEIELLKTICEEFEIRTEANTKKELLDDLNRFLLECLAKGETAVLIIDEAQNLSIEVLEEIRLLSNLETDKEKLIQIILIGQPELKDKLALPSLRQMDQRVTIRYRLDALSKSEVRKYINHRLSVAGSKGEIRFTGKAIDKIYDYSKGIPRLINQVCDKALLAAYVAKSYKITASMVGEALRSLDSGYEKEKKGTLKRLSLAAAIVLAFAIGLYSGSLYFVRSPQAVLPLLGKAKEVARPRQKAAFVSEVATGAKEGVRQRVVSEKTGPAAAPAGPSAEAPAENPPRSPETVKEKVAAVNLPAKPAEATPPAPHVGKDEGVRTAVPAEPPESAAVEVPLQNATAVTTREPSSAGSSSPGGKSGGASESDKAAGPAYVEKEAVTAAIAGEPGRAVDFFKFDTDGVARRFENVECAPDALATLLHMWNVDRDLIKRKLSKWYENAGKFDMRRGAEDLGFKTFSGNMTLGELLNYGYPCILRVRQNLPDRLKYVVLMNVIDGDLIIGHPRLGKIRVGRDELLKFWTGRAFILWRDPIPDCRVLKRPMQGEDVSILQGLLAKLGYLSEDDVTGVFGEVTEEAVREFQRDRNLTVDGVVGPRTKMMLYKLTTDEEKPTF